MFHLSLRQAVKLDKNVSHMSLHAQSALTSTSGLSKSSEQSHGPSSRSRHPSPPNALTPHPQLCSYNEGRGRRGCRSPANVVCWDLKMVRLERIICGKARVDVVSAKRNSRPAPNLAASVAPARRILRQRHEFTPVSTLGGHLLD